jgi:hypothetical protein
MTSSWLGLGGRHARIVVRLGWYTMLGLHGPEVSTVGVYQVVVDARKDQTHEADSNLASTRTEPSQA